LTAPLPPATSDPEFQPVASSRVEPAPEAGEYRRILVNPFLGFLATALWVRAVFVIAHAETILGLPQTVTAPLWCASIWLIPRLFRFHCLDCGRSGRLWRWKEHVCPTVAERVASGRTRTVRGPSPWVQLLIWVYVLAFGFLVVRATVGTDAVDPKSWLGPWFE